AFRAQRARQRQTPRDGRHPSVEGGVEACDLREPGEVGGYRLDAVKRGRKGERGERDQGPDRGGELGRDALWRRMVWPAVDDTMTGGVRGREPGARERVQRGARVTEHSRLVAHDPRRVADREAALAEPDPFDRGRRDPRLVLVERQLERR